MQPAKLIKLLYVQVLIGLALGITVGHYWPEFGAALKPLGDAFVKLVKMMIAPIVFCTIVSGITSLNDSREIGKTLLKSMGLFYALTILALLTGLAAVFLMQPGAGMHIDPAHLEWAGVAVMKKAYRLYQERGYRTRLLSAATRNHMHWSEFIGGNVVVTLTHSWQKRFNRSAIAVMPRMNTPVDDRIVQSLQTHFEEFRRAYDPEGMGAKDFDAFGATRRTLRSFIEGYHELVAMIRDFMIEDPDR